MRIGIDARMYGPEVGGGGLGRYVEQLVTELQATDTSHHYVLFLQPKNYEACKITNPSFEKRCIDIHWYTLKEQLTYGGLINREKLDLVHFPHWNVPWNVKTPFIVTIHDLILLEEPRSARATTRHPLVYWLKYQAFRLVLKRAVERSRHIIAVSQYTKDSIQRFFPKTKDEHVSVIHEGVTKLTTANPTKTRTLPSSPYLLYVGNAYPHKNLETLIQAFRIFHKKHPSIPLVLAGRQDVFYKRLKEKTKDLDLKESAILFFPSPTDAELAALYGGALAYVFPSRVEGFGLPPLEAMQHRTPVVAANTSCLPEILGEAALYMSPNDPEDIAEKLIRIVEEKDLREKLIHQGKKQLNLYSWKSMANHIEALYTKSS